MTEDKKFAPKCIWCNAEWSDENIQIEDAWASAGCETCGYGATARGAVNISCHACGKLMYVKEFEVDA